MTGNGQCEFGIAWIIGVNRGGFFYIIPAITAGSQFQCDFSLAAGRDLPRKRGRRATSAGFDTGNFELGRALVLHDVVVVDVLSTHHRLKIK